MLVYQRVIHLYLVGGIPTPLKNDGVRQLGLQFPMESHKIPWFQNTNQIIIYKSPTISNITMERSTMLSMGKSTDQIIL